MISKCSVADIFASTMDLSTIRQKSQFPVGDAMVQKARLRLFVLLSKPQAHDVCKVLQWSDKEYFAAVRPFPSISVEKHLALTVPQSLAYTLSAGYTGSIF